MDIDPESIKVSLHTTAPQDTSGPVMKPPMVSWGDTGLQRIISITYGHQEFVDRHAVINECIRAVRWDNGIPLKLWTREDGTIWMPIADAIAALEALKEQA